MAGADFIIDGYAWELKTVTEAGSNTLLNAMEAAAGQSRRMFIDATKFKYTDEFVEKQMNRLFSNLQRDKLPFPEEVIIFSEDTIYVHRLTAPGP